MVNHKSLLHAMKHRMNAHEHRDVAGESSGAMPGEHENVLEDPGAHMHAHKGHETSPGEGEEESLHLNPDEHGREGEELGDPTEPAESEHEEAPHENDAAGVHGSEDGALYEKMFGEHHDDESDVHGNHGSLAQKVRAHVAKHILGKHIEESGVRPSARVGKAPMTKKVY